MKIRQLRYFVAVAEELRLSRAARRLNLSLFPLNQQIKALEDSMGVQLLHRTRNSISLTPAGRDFYEQLVPWLANLDTMAARTRRVGEGEEGRLGVACSFATAQSLLPRVAKALRECHPTITLKLHEMPLERQLEAISKRVVDIGILRLPLHTPHLDSAPLYDEALMVALPAAHPLARRRRLSIADLRHETFLKANRESDSIFESIEATCRHAGFEANVLETSSTLNAAVGMVSMGMGITLIPDSMQWARPKHIVYRPLQDSPRSTVAAAWRRDSASPTIDRFVAIARRLAGEPDPRLDA